MEIGWLAPNGTMYECATMEHISVARDLAEKLGWKEYDENFNRTCWADDFLMNHGYVHITRSMMFGCEYHLIHEKHYTQAQKEWLKPRIEEDWEWLSKLDQLEWKEENEGGLL